MFPLAALFFLVTAPAHAAAPDTRAIDRPLARLERRIVDARQAGKISADDYDRLRAALANVRTMREEALADGVLTGAEMAALRKAVRDLEVEVAEARFGAHAAPAASGAQVDDDNPPELPALTGASVPRDASGVASGSAL